MGKIDINIKKYVDFEKRYELYEDYWNYMSKYMVYLICSDYLGIPFWEIRDYVNNAGVKLTKEEITTFLKEKEKEDNKNKTKKDDSDDCILLKGFIDNLASMMAKITYELDPLALEYYNTYLNNLKQNTINLINLVDNMDNDEYKEVFDSLDINVVNGKVNYEDIIRLCKPIIYNVLRLREVEKKANQKETYLYEENWDEIILNNGYPTVSYQVSTYEEVCEDGYIELTKRQKEEMRDKENPLIIFTLK